MDEIIIGILAFSFLGGLAYFGYKSQMFAVSRFLFFTGILVFPIGAMIGLYWAVQDFFISEFTQQLKLNSICAQDTLCSTCF
jgi:hypothetical protein